jgi:excisionase family DNA binding protein
VIPAPRLVVDRSAVGQLKRRYEEYLRQERGLSPWTVRLKIKSGELPAYRVGGVWRADESEIDNWLAARHQPGRATRLPDVKAPA